MDILLKQSQEIINEAITKYNPYATVLMFSGGNDSLTTFYVANALDIKVDFIIHINTRTGIQECTEYVRKFTYGMPYLEGNAGQSYENRVLEKGFFGLGQTAHSYAYHLLKAHQFRKVISHNIRHRKHNRNVLMLNGARLQESANRKNNLTKTINIDPNTKSNVWINLIHHWSKIECLDFLHDNKAELNPVSELVHRSGECMCGTMQSLEERKEASFWFPDWGKWLDNLENRVIENNLSKPVCKDFCWKWGETSTRLNEVKAGQLDMFTPMCHSCHLAHSDSKDI